MILMSSWEKIEVKAGGHVSCRLIWVSHGTSVYCNENINIPRAARMAKRVTQCHEAKIPRPFSTH
jgi:hypothetical protein